jgi:hypothetical protein
MNLTKIVRDNWNSLNKMSLRRDRACFIPGKNMKVRITTRLRIPGRLLRMLILAKEKMIIR